MSKKPPVKCCRTCALWDIEAAKDKAGRVRKDRVARCMWALTVSLPVSLHGWLRHGTGPRYMPSYAGEDCECWVLRAKEGRGQTND